MATNLENAERCLIRATEATEHDKALIFALMAQTSAMLHLAEVECIGKADVRSVGKERS